MEAKTKEKEKKFDAIKTMREIRDKMSLEIMNMTYEQERAYIDKLLAEGQTKST
ncbi:MAG: hypothetical protein ACKOBI_01490 [Bacteroidota bacterium]